MGRPVYPGGLTRTEFVAQLVAEKKAYLAELHAAVAAKRTAAPDPPPASEETE
jgi:hypothetical protein